MDVFAEAVVLLLLSLKLPLFIDMETRSVCVGVRGKNQNSEGSIGERELVCLSHT